MLGESVISCVLSENDHGTHHYGSVAVSFHIAFNLAMLYFDSMPHHAKDHVLRRSGLAGIFFSLLHLPLSITLLVAGAGIKFMVTYSDKVPTVSAAWLLCVCISVSVAIMSIIRILHQGIESKLAASCFVWIVRCHRALSFAAILCLPLMYGASKGGVSSLALLIIVDGILLSLVLAERYSLLLKENKTEKEKAATLETDLVPI